MENRKGKKGKIFLVVFFVFAGALLFLMSPVFSVKEITLNGNSRFSSRQVLDMADIYEGINIFKLSYSSGEKKLLENHYIKYAQIAVTLPDRVDISIIERKVCGYVPYMGAYLYIDQDGVVLESKSDLDESCPIVTGLKFQEFTVGDQLDTENEGSFSVVMTMSKIMLNYDYISAVKEMNISNPDDIHFYVGNIDVSFGDINEADKKMRIAIEAIKSIPEGDKGVLHVENVDNLPYFSYKL